MLPFVVAAAFCELLLLFFLTYFLFFMLKIIVSQSSKNLSDDPGSENELVPGCCGIGRELSEAKRATNLNGSS